MGSLVDGLPPQNLLRFQISRCQEQGTALGPAKPTRSESLRRLYHGHHIKRSNIKELNVGFFAAGCGQEGAIRAEDGAVDGLGVGAESFGELELTVLQSFPELNDSIDTASDYKALPKIMSRDVHRDGDTLRQRGGIAGPCA